MLGNLPYPFMGSISGSAAAAGLADTGLRLMSELTRGSWANASSSR
jgi:hypothetical protein